MGVQIPPGAPLTLIMKKFITVLFSLGVCGCTTSIPVFESHTTKASWYNQGTITASGAGFNPKSLTAAHRTLPFGTLVKITNLDNNKQVVAMITDRGPFIKDRGLDVSKQVAIELGFLKKGVAEVSYHTLQTPLK